jgi:hypothetical protein
LPKDRTFWLISLAIVLGFSVLGFWVVPEWNHYFRTPEQRYEYLIQSIWCPI